MPTRRCCCGPCYTFVEDFVRPGDDVELLVDHWHDCGDFSDWTITELTPGNGLLENTVAGAKLILDEMVGHPYGILRVHIQITPGAIYRVHVYHGTFSDPCTGETTVVEVECGPDANEGILRIIQGSTTLDEVEFSGIADDDLLICVGDRIIEASLTSTSDTLRYCGTVSGYWFALEGVTHTDNPGEQITQWSDLQYSDHWEHDKRCPRCSRHCCFPLFNKVIAGFNVTISGIAEGTAGDCECETLMEFFLEVEPDTDLCECVTAYSINGANGTVAGPHGCPGLSENTSQPIITMDCDNETRLISWQFDMFILDDGDSEIHAQTTFDPDTDPDDIRATGLTFYDTGNGESCNYESATITFTPVLVDDCCSEVIEVGTEVRAKLTELPAADHDALIEMLRGLQIESDKGLGDTANRLLANKKHELYVPIRRWFKVYSCSRSQACRMVNRLFPS